MSFITPANRYANVATVTDVFVREPRIERPEVQAEMYPAIPTAERSVSEASLDGSTRHAHVSGDAATRLVDFLDDHVHRV